MVLNQVSPINDGTGDLSLLPADTWQKDRFNVHRDSKELINVEIRDQADRQYVDLKTRDINGNVKSAIGDKIDFLDQTKLYLKDIEHERKLQKLS